MTYAEYLDRATTWNMDRDADVVRALELGAQWKIGPKRKPFLDSSVVADVTGFLRLETESWGDGWRTCSVNRLCRCLEKAFNRRYKLALVLE